MVKNHQERDRYRRSKRDLLQFVREIRGNEKSRTAFITDRVETNNTKRDNSSFPIYERTYKDIYLNMFLSKGWQNRKLRCVIYIKIDVSLLFS